ncbi:MAG: biotin carboxylase N-terminal domain-containing protein [Acidimicrobiales bacterium]
MTTLHRPPIDRVLIANRGEIARRIIRTCRRLGIGTVAVYSDADEDAPYVREADLAVRLPGTASADTYLRVDLLIAAAERTGAQAIHPGYGFLSERPDAAEEVARAGLVWIGPPASAIAAMGSKIGAKQLMRAAGVPVLPDNTVESLDEIGLPALVKASAGGGGRGMRVVRTADELDEAIASAEREAISAFGDGTVFVERYVEGGRHVEIQVFADTLGTTVSLFERDCTLQRRHQKIVEETPSPAVDDELRQRMGNAAVAAARAVGYVGAGTVEFLLDRSGNFFFLEMNTRLQVEHPVTEMITGLDLVELQLRVADGEPLPHAAVDARRDGHAIEVRLCAEDPRHGYRPSSGTFHVVEFPVLEGVRIDSGIESGSVVSPYYDSMVAKVIAHGPTRRIAARRIVQALTDAVIVGPVTNRHQLIHLASILESIDDVVDTTYLDRTPMGPAVPPSAELVGAAAVAVLAHHDAARTALPDVPAGWRNVPSQDQQLRLGEHVVSYRRDRWGQVAHLVVDGVGVDPQAARDLCRLRPPLIVGDHVHLLGGRTVLEIVPRFVLPDEAGRAGSLVAPMPGSVLRILVEPGQTVVPGQPMLTLEAMKMEHQVVAPAAGVVAEILVTVGQQLDTGQLLVQVETGEGDVDASDGGA